MPISFKEIIFSFFYPLPWLVKDHIVHGLFLLGQFETMYSTGSIWKGHLKHSSCLIRPQLEWRQPSSLRPRSNQLCPYQWFSSRVQLVFGASQQEIPSQDVESLSASFRAVVHLSFPQLVLIEWGAAQESRKKQRRCDGFYVIFYIVGFTKSMSATMPSSGHNLNTCPIQTKIT